VRGALTPETLYEEAGAAIDLSKESVGCIHLRCLDKLRRILESKNFHAF